MANYWKLGVNNGSCSKHLKLFKGKCSRGPCRVASLHIPHCIPFAKSRVIPDNEQKTIKRHLIEQKYNPPMDIEPSNNFYSDLYGTFKTVYKLCLDKPQLLSL